MPFKKFRIGRATCAPGRPLIVGILNVTPDSFSDGGAAFSKRDAVRKALRLEQEGADIIDIGGESSRPNAEPVTLSEEIRRVTPVIEAIRKKSGIPISIDTAKAEVARKAVEAGANMLNDIYGFTSPEMAQAAADLKVPVVIMHMKGNPATMQKNPRYGDVTREVTLFLERQCALLAKRGVKKIIVDPGIGFGKTLKQNLTLLADIKKIAKLGLPVMVGASRKSFIGKITGAGVGDRLAGTLTTHIHSVMQGAALIRVHDVKEHRQALDILFSILPK